MNIALKEANETGYWLMLLKDTTYISIEEFDSINDECTSIIKMLISIVKPTKQNLKK